jgi:excisionase family DNA binding protein
VNIKMESQSKRVYSVDEVAEIFDVNPRTIYRMLNRGDLLGIKLGNQWRIPKDYVDNMLDVNNRKVETNIPTRKLELEDLEANDELD